MTSANSAMRLLNVLFPPGCGLIELRAIRIGRQGIEGRQFIEPGAGDSLNAFIKRYQDIELYFGVAARKDSSSGELRNCSNLNGLFQDIDLRENPNGKKRLDEFPYQPTALVSSGGGYHAYWKFTEPVNVQEEASRIKSVLQRLAYAIDGDQGSAEPAHIR
jgi:hypothetical protein